MNVKRMIKLYLLYAKMDLAWLVRDTKMALFAVLADSVSAFSAVAGMFLLAVKFGGVGDLGENEVLFMLGYANLSIGVFDAFFSFNTGNISRRISRGQMEHMLLQPLPLPIQLVTEGFIPFTGAGSLFTGAAILWYAANRLALPVSLGWLASLAANILVTAVIILSLSYLFSSAAFYAPVAAEEISTTVLAMSDSLSRFPLSGMPLALTLPLISAFPAGLIAWFPALTLLGKPPLHLPPYFAALIALALFLLMLYTFRKGFLHYVKVGSNRYLSYGHRR
jgi:ABC-2 type transport system permease protein